jgi:hypothetical protein
VQTQGEVIDDHVNYFALLARLTQVGNLEACLLTGIQTVFMENYNPRSCLDDLTLIADGGHNMVTLSSHHIPL